jgi:Glyoxalase/Bleomycin resistance protein/Dioxygenase superfamily
MAEFPAPTAGFVATHFIVVSDVERSRRFYTEVLGGETVRSGEPTYVALANSWIIINVGGGPTEDKPRSRSRLRRISTGRVPSSTCASPTCTVSMSCGADAAPTS